MYCSTGAVGRGTSGGAGTKDAEAGAEHCRAAAQVCVKGRRPAQVFCSRSLTEEWNVREHRQADFGVLNKRLPDWTAHALMEGISR
ncbi:hypothetical protein V5799_022928 [Amblyomma americanum]|uniref:Uncharacterized protein n=1 Tax=Amblyomma americanum TaxID=6943 RepID=A0AAQ4FJ37_AMBAM